MINTNYANIFLQIQTAASKNPKSSGSATSGVL